MPQTVNRSVMDTGKYCVNRATGVWFVSHLDMFSNADPEGNRQFVPDNLEFFSTEEEARELSEEISATLRAKAGQPGPDKVTSVPVATDVSGDSRKLPSKSEAQRIARERYSVDLVVNRSRRNVDQQFLAAHCAHQFGGDAQAAVVAAASSEHDQIPNAA